MGGVGIACWAWDGSGRGVPASREREGKATHVLWQWEKMGTHMWLGICYIAFAEGVVAWKGGG